MYSILAANTWSCASFSQLLRVKRLCVQLSIIRGVRQPILRVRLVVCLRFPLTVILALSIISASPSSWVRRKDPLRQLGLLGLLMLGRSELGALLAGLLAVVLGFVVEDAECWLVVDLVALLRRKELHAHVVRCLGAVRRSIRAVPLV